MDEVDAAVAQLGRAREVLALLHCVSSYPADPKDCNLRVMAVMRERYRVPVGWSDHTEGTAISVAAATLGAQLIEKHLTLGKDMPGPDHRASLEPAEMRAMVDGIRAAEAALGEPVKQPSPAEQAIAAVARKSLHWSRALAPGETVDADDLIPLRPGTAIAPSRAGELVGRRARVATVAGAIASFDDLER
jgi:N-acetylneuraminate synthase/N,N'-diacetyllegionaminate synthase